MKPWTTVATATTKEGVLELRQRGDEFLMVIDGRVLMTSRERRSEERLATLGCATLSQVPVPGRGVNPPPSISGPRVLVGGLGMAYTLRAALDVLPASAEVVVAELVREVDAWCRGPLASLTNHAVVDPRVSVVIEDVSRVIATARPGEYDAILLDLYEGPHAASQRGDDPFYGPGALARTHAAIARSGVLAVWSEDPDDAFLRRFRAAGFEVSVDRSGTSRTHIVYVGRRR